MSTPAEERSLKATRGVVTELSVGQPGHLASAHDWIKLEPQPDAQTVVVKCHRCGVTQTFALPQPLNALTTWLDQVDRAHGTCILVSENCPPK